MIELLNPELIRQLAGAVSKLHPDSRGCKTFLIAPEAVSTCWVHVRPYLKDEGTPHGYRIEEAKGHVLVLCEEPSYPNLFVRWGDAELPPEVYKLLGEAEQRRIPWLMVEGSHGSETLYMYDQADGSRKSLTASNPSVRPKPLSMTIEGNRLIGLTEFLPFDIHVNSETPTAAFSVNIKSSSASFARKAYHFILADAQRKRPGAGAVRVDVRCRAGALDEIIASSSGFNSSVSLLEQELGVAKRPQPRFSPGVVRLHVIFDRTTLDADAWPLALAALGSGIVQESSDEMYHSRGEPTVLSWNQQTREALADALVNEVEALHRGDVEFQLWWFADTPRGGIAQIKNTRSLRATHGGGEQCAASGLKARLCGPTFEYAPGFDLFDGVDEALQRVVEHIGPMSRHSDKQHAVLIVGDSPPPPTDKNDILWARLVEGPPRTNARRSPHFRAALQSLQEMKIPVGWLFIQSRVPLSKPGYKEYESQFQYFQSLRQRVLEALSQVLTMVEACSGVEDMASAARKLLEEMGRKAPATPLLHFGDVVAHGAGVEAWR